LITIAQEPHTADLQEDRKAMLDAGKLDWAMGELIATQVDLPRVLKLADTAAPLASPRPQASAAEPVAPPSPPRVRIGLARDPAFGFYYPDDLQALEAAGATIIPFNTLRDTCLPEVDGLFIGGGFPEMFMDQLQANVALRQDIRTAIDAGLPVYAECGGLMYLARTLQWKGQIYQMAGALPADVVMHERPVGRGYVELQTTADAPWSAGAGPAPQTLRGHEFHYSSLENLAEDQKFAYKVVRGHGVDGARDGIVHRNVLASYAHLRSGSGSDWAVHFVAFVRSNKHSSK